MEKKEEPELATNSFFPLGAPSVFQQKIKLHHRQRTYENYQRSKKRVEAHQHLQKSGVTSPLSLSSKQIDPATRLKNLYSGFKTVRIED